MNRLLLSCIILLFSSSLAADCGRLKAGDNYENLNAILDCIETKPSKSPLLNNGVTFLPGEYTDSNGYQYLLSGGGIIGEDRTTWNIRIIKGSDFDASWTTGPAIGHPQIGALSVASKLPKGLSYGVMGKVNRSYWKQGGLIAVTQAGDSITVWAYHEDKSPLVNLEYAVNNLVLTQAKATNK
ncbi:MAG: hypothetical protein IPN66_17895 [Candidatus Competibacteraceae bacterium]|nr:hypothetical protein [Candidatus Competibacteraceae bacterium]MBK8963075.1 hypothetical protein [Candidatus Competibacteraceae bacterium]